jgi:hypothetical protein
MGTQTLQRYNCDPLDAGVQWSEEGPTSRHDPGAAPVFPESTIAYRRWFWQTIEPTIPISTAKRCSGGRAICGNIGSYQESADQVQLREALQMISRIATTAAVSPRAAPAFAQRVLRRFRNGQAAATKAAVLRQNSRG